MKWSISKIQQNLIVPV